MVRILILLVILLLSQVKVVKAQSSKTIESQTESNSCDRFNPPLRQNNLPQNNPIVSRRLASQTNENDFNPTQLKSESNRSFNSATSFNTNSGRNTNSVRNAKDAMEEEPKVATARVSSPSLWWAKEQFDPFGGRLISSWRVYPQIEQIDLTVNWQLWTLLDYLGRYRFINQFGTVAREYGYSLRIFNRQQQCLAYYEYNPEINPPKWEISIEGVGQDSFQVDPAED